MKVQPVIHKAPPIIHIGDRVAWHRNPDTKGTVREIFLSKYPFYVVWDKGKDDWYQGEDLIRLEDQQPLRSTNMDKLNESDLEKMEKMGCGQHSEIGSLLTQAVCEIRRLQHELADPRFLYSGSRIQRTALIARDQEVMELRGSVAELEKEIQKLKVGAVD
jgi:hypothetical protein